MLVGAKAGDAVAGLFWGLGGDQEASLERVALAALAAGKRRTAGDVRPQAARHTVRAQALSGRGIGAFEVPALVPHPLGDKHILLVQPNRAPAVAAPAMRVLGDADDVPILVNPDLAPGFVPGDVAVRRAVFGQSICQDTLDLLDAGELAPGIAFMSGLVLRCPDNPDFLRTLGQVLNEAGALEESLIHLPERPSTPAG